MIKIPDRYKPDGGLDSGGFGAVVFCEDRHLSRRVAIKFIKNPVDNRRVLDEIHALLKLRSKHVVQIYDIIHGRAGEIGIVEEFIDGPDLWDHPVPRKSIEIYLKTLWQISSGLADIHSFGIIHRDIKPNNMKLDHESIIKIYDFGLAREEGPDAVTKGFVGTHGFSAPELYETETVTFSSAIDVYAFAATAYFLTGKRLPEELIKVPPEPLATEAFLETPVQIPSSLAGLLAQCLDHDPYERPNMAAVRDEIARRLLRNRHQALAVLNGEAFYLNANKRKVRLELSEVGKVEIGYDGLRFSVKSVEGEVYVNNRSCTVGLELPGSCVVAIGGGHRPSSQRAFISFDVSNPEVIV